MVLSGAESYHFVAGRGVLPGDGCKPKWSQRKIWGTRWCECPYHPESIFPPLERVAQGELHQPRRAHGRENPAEGARDLHVRSRAVAGVREVGMVPDVEEIRREAQGLPLRQPEVFDEGKIPVLLVRSAVDVAPKIAEQRRAEIKGGIAAARGGIHKRRSYEVRRIEVAIVHAVVNIAAREARADRATGREACAGGAGCQPATDECSSGGRINDRKWRAGLKDGDSADGPVLEDDALGAGRLLEERQVVAVTDRE